MHSYKLACVCTYILYKLHMVYKTSQTQREGKIWKTDLVVLDPRTLPSMFLWRWSVCRCILNLSEWDAKDSYSECLFVSFTEETNGIEIFLAVMTQECTLDTDPLQHRLPNGHYNAGVLQYVLFGISVAFRVMRIPLCSSDGTFPHVICSRAEYWTAAWLLSQNEQ